MRIIHWLCDLGRVDLIYKLSLLSEYMAQPRIRHLEKVLTMLFYLKHNVSMGWLIYGPYDYEINWNPRRPNEVPPQVRAETMKLLYNEATETILMTCPLHVEKKSKVTSSLTQTTQVIKLKDNSIQ